MTALWPLALVVLAAVAFTLYRRWRSGRLRERPFPAQWEDAMVRAVPVFPALPPEQQQRLRELVKVFIDDKVFYGCAGLVVTDDMRVIVAAQACLLLLNNQQPVYPDLRSILVYPSTFRVDREEYHDDGTVSFGGRDLAGESWSDGKVILAWDSVENGVSDFNDGQNVVLHEFAHQLDAASGSTNGAPPLRRNSYRTWSAVFSSHFDNLQARAWRHEDTVMDTYGATNPAEFFAVATETFFEKPHELAKHRPELYEQLSQYYQLDPRQWWIAQS